MSEIHSEIFMLRKYITYSSGVLVEEFRIDPANMCRSWRSLSDEGKMDAFTIAAEEQRVEQK